MRALWILGRIRLLDTLRSRSSAAFVFAFPIGLIVIVGLVFAQGHPFEYRRIIIVEPASDVPARRGQRQRPLLVKTSCPSLGCNLSL